jgi:hypothetical protein
LRLNVSGQNLLVRRLGIKSDFEEILLLQFVHDRDEVLGRRVGI